MRHTCNQCGKPFNLTAERRGCDEYPECCRKCCDDSDCAGCRQSAKVVRKHYKNGDEITRQHRGCDGCSPSMVNGILCHEYGCPDAWRDYKRQGV